ncbi:MAG TPA: PilZ domain-containing protein [Polyangiales bacterium]|jgi:hypothetical protein|nr:PilZ domain-containing protein [Polyangiales bacterium]
MSSEDGHKPRETRVTINKDFESFDEFIREYVTNISKTGAFVKRASPLPVGTEVNLKFTVIVDSVETIEGVGKVVRVQHDPPGMGVVFTSISQYSQHLLERMLTQQHTTPDA